MQHVIVQHLKLLAAFLVTSLRHGLPALRLQGRGRSIVGLCRRPEEHASGQGSYQGEHHYHREAARDQYGAARADVRPRAKHPGHGDRRDRPGRDPPGGEKRARNASSADGPEHPIARRGGLSCGKRAADDDGARDGNGNIRQYPPGRQIIPAERGREQNRRPRYGEQITDQDSGREARDATTPSGNSYAPGTGACGSGSPAPPTSSGSLGGVDMQRACDTQ